MTSMSSFISHLIQVIVYALGLCIIVIGLSFCLGYLHAYTIKNDVENFMLDMLAYGTKHNGFNDPEDGSYTFSQTEQNLLKRHNIDKYVDSVSYSPSVGTQVKGRSGTISMSVRYKYPTLNPLDSSTTSFTYSNTKTVSDVVHGYVKETRKSKTFDANRPWWLWDDERWVP